MSDSERIKALDEKIVKITERYSYAKKSDERPLTLKGKNVVWEVIVDLCAIMAVGLVLGYFLDKHFSLGKWCFTVCVILASLACVNKITKIR